jgi:hypothetical protein
VWTALASLPRARSHIAASTFVMNGRIIVVGGETAHGVGIPDVTAYDPVANTWSELSPLPSERQSPVAGVINGTIYSTTGSYTTATYKGSPVVLDGPGGLAGQYFDNADFTNLKVTRTDPTVNFNWGTGSPDAAIGPDSFSVRWTGKVKADVSETYTFYTTSNDGVRLWINNQLLVDNWKTHPTTENSGKITLQAGQWYSVRLEYVERKESAVIALAYSSPSTPKQIIPANNLAPSAP